MKTKLTKAILMAALILAFALCLIACKKNQTDPATEGTAKPVILENEGDLEIIVPDDQDTFGE